MALFDPYMPEIKTDPLPIYARLRAEAPVYYVERFDAWALARFEDIWTASQDAEHFSTCNATSDLAFLQRQPAPFEALSNMDRPEHTAARSAVFPLFGPSAARRLSSSMREWTRNALDAHADSGRIDAASELAQQVAVRVACSIAGFPLRDSDFLVDVVSRFFQRAPGTDGLTESGIRARAELQEYLTARVEEACTSEGSDSAARRIVGYLQSVGAEDDLVARASQHLILLVIGATETFPKVFASGLLRLWQHPDQRREIAKDPSLIPTALTEILRYDMPTQWLGRTVVRDTEIGGHKLRTGQPVMFLYPSGNRDALEFDEPDRFDIHRNAQRILTFGHGVHRCLGSFMARMEGQILLEEVLARYPEYEVLEDETVFPATEFVQGYSHFPIAFAN